MREEGYYRVKRKGKETIGHFTPKASLWQLVGSHLHYGDSDFDEIDEVRIERRGWISVNDRLPDEFIDVLVTDGEKIRISCVDSSGTIDSYIIYGEVTHWQPLPDPPAE